MAVLEVKPQQIKLGSREPLPLEVVALAAQLEVRALRARRAASTPSRDSVTAAEAEAKDRLAQAAMVAQQFAAVAVAAVERALR